MSFASRVLADAIGSSAIVYVFQNCLPLTASSASSMPRKVQQV
jgi:hypothetical protein